MLEYIKAHWRGQLSLARSYWINGVLLSAVIYTAAIFAEGPLAQQDLERSIVVSLALIGILAGVVIWQLVGIWRSANHHTNKTGRVFWPAVAKLMVIVGFLSNAGQLSTTTTDLLNLRDALREPDLAHYAIERRGDTDLILTGAINDQSVAEVIAALETPTIEILRVNSHGGLIESATSLARYIRQNQIMVMAEGQCMSACTMLLAASPYGAVVPGTAVTFHRAEAVVEFETPELRAETEQYLQNADDFYRELGMPNWALETMQRQPLWTPNLKQLLEMELVKLVYDLEQRQFVLAGEYCARHPEECAASTTHENP